MNGKLFPNDLRDDTVTSIGEWSWKSASKIILRNDIKITFIGDSITQGVGATFDLDDYPTIVCNALGTKYGISVNKSNRGIGGRTVALFMAEGHFNDAIADKSDIYFISFGHNDLRSDGNLPGTGYPLNASLAGIEHMIRRIRVEVPLADIVLLGENPYYPNSSNNAKVISYNSGMKQLALMYGCLYVDGYEAFSKVGDWTSYLSDNGHPNPQGYILLRDAILSNFSDNLTSDNRTPAFIPDEPLYQNVVWYDRKNWAFFNSLTRTYGEDTFRLLGSWSSNVTLPCTTSTVGDSINAIFNGNECMAYLDCGAGQGVVDINVDGKLIYDNIDLTVYDAGSWKIPITGLAAGLHNVSITLVSGSITYRGGYVLHSPSEFIDVTSTRVTFTGTWTASNVSDAYNNNRKVTSTTGDNFTFEFIGTGFGIQMYRRTGGITLTPNVDGVDYPVVNTATDVDAWGGVTLISGLEYGKHVVTVSLTKNVNNFSVSGLFVFDETRLLRKRMQRGVALVGETVKFGCPFASTPLVKATGNGVYPANETFSNFVLNGTAGQSAIWEAEGSLVAY